MLKRGFCGGALREREKGGLYCRTSPEPFSRGSTLHKMTIKVPNPLCPPNKIDKREGYRWLLNPWHSVMSSHSL